MYEGCDGGSLIRKRCQVNCQLFRLPAIIVVVAVRTYRLLSWNIILEPLDCTRTIGVELTDTGSDKGEEK